MIIARYILREHVAPFFYALFVITFLFLVDFLIRILSSILSKGLGWRVVLEIVVLNLAWMLALSIPMAVLVATLMAFGRLSADNEVTALKSLGVSPLRAMLPVLAVAAALCAGMVWFDNDVLPDANHRAAALRNDIGRKKPTALIAPRTLIKDFQGYRIWIDSLDDRSGRMAGVKIYSVEPGKPLRYTWADSATMEYANGGATILIHLAAGENHVPDPKEPQNYVRVKFRGQDVAIDNVDASLERHERAYRSDREMSVRDMRKIVKDARAREETLRSEYAAKLLDEMRALDIVLRSDTGAAAREVPPRLLGAPWWSAAPVPRLTVATVRKQEKDKLYYIERYQQRNNAEEATISDYMVEIHKKFSIPVACLVFVFIGAPLGIMARRGGIGTGSIYSLAFFLLYWAGLIRGEALADQLLIPPWVAMWGPNLVVGLGGAFLVARMRRENYLSDTTLLQRAWRLLSRPFRRPAAAGGG